MTSVELDALIARLDSLAHTMMQNGANDVGDPLRDAATALRELRSLNDKYWPFIEAIGNCRQLTDDDYIDAIEMVRERERAETRKENET